MHLTCFFLQFCPKNELLLLWLLRKYIVDVFSNSWMIFRIVVRRMHIVWSFYCKKRYFQKLLTSYTPALFHSLSRAEKFVQLNSPWKKKNCFKLLTGFIKSNNQTDEDLLLKSKYIYLEYNIWLFTGGARSVTYRSFSIKFYWNNIPIEDKMIIVRYLMHLFWFQGEIWISSINHQPEGALNHLLNLYIKHKYVDRPCDLLKFSLTDF